MFPVDIKISPEHDFASAAAVELVWEVVQKMTRACGNKPPAVHLPPPLLHVFNGEVAAAAVCGPHAWVAGGSSGSGPRSHWSGTQTRSQSMRLY